MNKEAMDKATATHPAEKTFAKKLKKAGWHTYRDEDTGRVVTNAYPEERMLLQRICGLSCEIVSKPNGDEFCARIGPVLT